MIGFHQEKPNFFNENKVSVNVRKVCKFKGKELPFRNEE